MTKNKPRRYSILIVPENNSKVRRFEFSKNWFTAALSFMAFAFFMICLSGAALVHYYRAYNATEDARVRSAQFEREKGSLLARVADLETSISRTQRFAAKLGAISKSSNKNKTGVGPLDTANSLKTALTTGENSAFWKALPSDSSADDVVSRIDLLKQNTAELEERLHAVFAEQQDKMFFWASLPTAWPTRGFITSKFGAVRGYRLHEGLDIAASPGTLIMAPGDGLVTYTGYKGGYGNTIILDHGYGVSTTYAHCSSIFAQEGDRIKRGEVIAAVGNTGSSTGPHLHYEVQLDGIPVDPMRYLAKR